MLILARKAGESLVIGDNIELTILSVESNGNVTLGINASKDVLILRKELQQATSLNQEAASASCSEQMLQCLESMLSPHTEKKSKP